jgi:chromosome segregation ATPase
VSVLEIQSGKQAGDVHDLSTFSGPILLGKRRKGIQIKDPWIAMSHAEITCEGGEYRIADKRSKAGTFVNGDSIGKSSRVLKHGDTIALGKTQILFKSATGAAVSAPPPGGGAAPAASAASGPFTPHAAPASGPFTPAGAPSAEEARKLKAELERTKSDLKSVRQAFARRNQELAQAKEQVRQYEAGGGDPEVAARMKAAEAQVAKLEEQLRDTTNKGRIRIEELTRLNKALEGRFAQAGQGGVVAQEKEIARLREEGRKLQEEARSRLKDLTDERRELKAQLEGAVSRADLEGAQKIAQEAIAEANSKAEAAEQKLDDMKASFGELMSEKQELEYKVGDLESQITTLGKSGDEMHAMEEVVRKLNDEVAKLKDELMLERSKALAASAGSASAAGDAKAQALEEKLAAAEKQAQEASARAAKAEADLKRASQSKETGSAEAGRVPELEVRVAELEKDLADANGRAAEAEKRAAEAPAAGGGGGGGDTEALEARIKELEDENEGLLRDLEEINEDMLAQEEEYMERSQELEDAAKG